MKKQERLAGIFSIIAKSSSLQLLKKSKENAAHEEQIFLISPIRTLNAYALMGIGRLTLWKLNA